MIFFVSLLAFNIYLKRKNSFFYGLSPRSNGRVFGYRWNWRHVNISFKTIDLNADDCSFNS